MYHSNPDRPHRPAKAVRADLLWWTNTLSSHTLTLSVPTLEPYYDILAFSDTSNHGLGLVIGKAWAAFQFSEHFRQRNRDIAWAEAAAV